MLVSCTNSSYEDNKAKKEAKESENYLKKWVEFLDEQSVRQRLEEKKDLISVKIGNLEVMNKDLGAMTWDDAMKACADLGDGWRLPTKEELNILYENKDEIGGFTDYDYWSSTEHGNGAAWHGNGGAWGQVFEYGGQYTSGKNFNGYVRAVRAF